MKHVVAKLLTLGLLIFYFGCEPPTTSLTGEWDCTLIGVSGQSSAWMQLTENDGQLTGTFKWDNYNLNLQINGTVNSKRQVNLETQNTNHRVILTLRVLKNETYLDGSFAYYENNFWLDGGGFGADKR